MFKPNWVDINLVVFVISAFWWILRGESKEGFFNKFLLAVALLALIPLLALGGAALGLFLSGGH